jgi:guanylate kinase
MTRKGKGRLFVISAPAGTGKTTLVNQLVAKNEHYTRAVTCTTRPPRPGEKHKRDYYFLSLKAFHKKKDRGDFLESASVFGYHYGTSQQEIRRLERAGKTVFLVIDTQGAMELKKKGACAVFVFICPPSLAALKNRLEMRKTEDIAMIQKRLTWAKKEMKMVGYYDYCVVNKDLQEAYAVLKSIVVAEEHRVKT